MTQQTIQDSLSAESALNSTSSDTPLPIGGGYLNSSQIEPLKNSAFTRIHSSDRALIDAQIDTEIHIAHRLNKGESSNNTIDEARALRFKKAEALGALAMKMTIEDFVNTCRSNFCTVEKIIHLREKAASKQLQANIAGA